MLETTLCRHQHLSSVINIDRYQLSGTYRSLKTINYGTDNNTVRFKTKSLTVKSLRKFVI